MLIFCHLFAAIVLGSIMSKWLMDDRVFTVVVVGGILPDLIDKPLGHALLSESQSYGRIFTHGAFAFIIPLLIAGVVSKREYRLVLTGIGMGILLHQALDLMFLESANWLFPLLGPHHPQPLADFFEYAIRNEVLAISEWLFLLLSISMLSVRWRALRRLIQELKIRRLADQLIEHGPIALIGLAAIVIMAKAVNTPSLALGYDDPGSEIVLVTTCIMSAMVLRLMSLPGNTTR